MAAEPVAIYGAVTGTCALAFTVATFLRDRGRVQVEVSFDHFKHDGGLLQREPHARVTVFNAGRRPVLITAAYLHFRGHTAILDQFEPRRLEEGGPPLIVYAPYTPELAAVLADRWWQAEGLAFGVGGRMYRSRLPRFKPTCSDVERPSRWTRERHLARSRLLALRGKVKRFLHA